MYKLEYEVFENYSADTDQNQIWIAFHGIGQNTTAFKKFSHQHNLKVYSFGLFYHEKNQQQVETRRETDIENWLSLMKNFIENEEIKDKSINIIGFSLGVRSVLQLVRHFSDMITFEKIFLIAPETLAVSHWYRLGTQTLVGKFLLKKVVCSDSFKEIIISISAFIFPTSAQKLIRYQIYNGISSMAFAWLAYRQFEIDGTDWKLISEKNKDKITIVASKKDAFVGFKTIQKFIRKNSFDKGKSIQWRISESPHASLLREFDLKN